MREPVTTISSCAGIASSPSPPASSGHPDVDGLALETGHEARAREQTVERFLCRHLAMDLG
jgi:hypothetical protein